MGMDRVLPAVVAVVLGYLLGSVSFALLVGRVVGGIDIREHGSGNAGATNVGRVLGRRYGLAVFALDFGKGLTAVLVVRWIAVWWPGSDPAVAAGLGFYVGLAAILGHMYPWYLRFRGGKGVAAGSGVFVALMPLPALLAAAVWAAVLGWSRYMSLASVAAAVSLPVSFALLEPERALGPRRDLLAGTILVALLVGARHRSNLRRLLRGAEPRIGAPGGGRGGGRGRSGGKEDGHDQA